MEEELQNVKKEKKYVEKLQNELKNKEAEYQEQI